MIRNCPSTSPGHRTLLVFLEEAESKKNERIEFTSLGACTAMLYCWKNADMPGNRPPVDGSRRPVV